MWPFDRISKFFLSSTKIYKEMSNEFVMYCSSWNINNIARYITSMLWYILQPDLKTACLCT